jgi:ubiquinone/menaquinone biosynthesis C-methylase UbiE
MQHDFFKKLFGPQAENYTKYREPYPKELYTLLLAQIPEGSSRILDLACGTGKSTEPLAELGLQVVGVDHDPQMIEEAKKQAQLKSLDIEYAVAEAEYLPFPDGHFDVVTVGTAFHFFINETALSEIRRVLKPKGLLFVYWTVTTKETPEEDTIPGTIFQKYNWVKVPFELRELGHISDVINKAGFNDISTKTIPIIFNTTVEERVGLLTTSGFYETLSEEDKKSFLNEVREVLTKKLGNRAYFTLEEEIQVCFGFKS